MIGNNFRHHYGVGWPPVLSDLWRYPRWLLFHRKRIAYIPWSFAITLRKMTSRPTPEDTE